MSNIFKQHYTAYQRAILREFMSEQQLTNLDKAYNKAKVARVRKQAKRASRLYA